MAQRRSKTQARRSGGRSGMPGWMWLVIGIGLTLVLLAVLVLGGFITPPKLLSRDGDGFFRPRPNPDAQPAAVDNEDAGIADAEPAQRAAPGRSADAADPAADEREYDFYTLLPGKEVPLTDAELAASARAEAAREAADAERAARRDDTVLPRPVDERPADQREARGPATDATAARAPDAPAAATVTDADTRARYVLQAGAFQASGQAEELKAKIALLGLGARVEAAQIGGRTVFRVRMGPYGTAAELADAKDALERGGLPAVAVRVR